MSSPESRVNWSVPVHEFPQIRRADLSDLHKELRSPRAALKRDRPGTVGVANDTGSFACGSIVQAVAVSVSRNIEKFLIASVGVRQIGVDRC
jgi:hypothetical protein